MANMGRSRRFSSVCIVFYVIFVSQFGIIYGLNTFADVLKQIQNASDPRIYPTADIGNAVDVSVSMYLKNVHAIDEEAKSLQMEVYLRQIWKDPRARYSDGPHYLTLSGKTCVELLWIPDLFLVNSRETEIRQTVSDDMGCRIIPDGTIYLSSRTGLKLDCDMDLHRFPMDVQVCPLHIETYLNTQATVTLSWVSNVSSALIDSDIHTAFQLMDIKVDKSIKNFQQFATERLTLTLTLQRLSQHYLAVSYAPTLLLVVFNCVLLWIPFTAFIERMVISVGTLLAMIIFMVSSQYATPQVGYLKALDVWMLSCFIFHLVAPLQTLILHLMVKQYTTLSNPGQFELMKEEDASKDQSRASQTDQTKLVTGIPVHHLHKVDLIIKFAYPGLFIIFNIVYWSTYAS